jgi:hypothetical protein
VRLRDHSDQTEAMRGQGVVALGLKGELGGCCLR